MPDRETSRRDFVSFLAGSPLLAAAGLDVKTFNRLFAATPRGAEEAMAAAQQLATQSTVIKSAKDARDVLDFEAAAKAKIPVAHWAISRPAPTMTRPSARTARATSAGRSVRAASST